MFIRFNVFRSSGFLPRRMLEVSISSQISKTLKSNIMDITTFLKEIESKHPNFRAGNKRIRLSNAREFLLNQIRVYEKVKETGDPKKYTQRKKTMHAFLLKFIELARSVTLSQKSNGSVIDFWSVVQRIENFNFSKKI